MTASRLAVALAVLAGCARSSALEAWNQVPDPVAGEDAATLPELEAGTLPDVEPTRDAQARDATIDTSVVDAAVVDAAAADAGVPDSAMQDSAVEPGPGTLTVRMVQVGGTSTRSYQLYLPGGLDASKPLPLVSVHHPYGQNGQYMATITTWRQLADRERFVVAFPDGGGGQPWNVGENVCNWGTIGAAPSTQDDIGFVRTIVADIATVQAVAAEQVFVVGLSMGAYFANHIGCQGRDVVRAVAAHSGGTYAGSCTGDPVPVLLIHGDADSLIPLKCSRDAIGYWATRNGCSTSTQPEGVKQGTCLWNAGCPAGREIGLCIMKGMDHGWAGAAVTGTWLTSQYGGGTQYEDGAQMSWKFFKTYL